jgi:class II flagellar assembly regulator FliX
MTIVATSAVVPPAEPSLPVRRPAVADSGFSVPGSVALPGHAETSTIRDAPAATGAGAMLALQEHIGQAAGSAAELADREARRHGQDLLEALAALQKELLAGGGDAAVSLSRLSALADMISTAHDPALAQILGAIRLRARLEILRLSRGPGRAEPAQGEAGDPASVTGS